MHFLFETSVGYALFKVDKNTFTKATSWSDLPQDPEGISNLLELSAFKPFADAKDSLQASVKMIHGKLSSSLAEFIRTNIVSEKVKETLLVGEKKIASEISKKLGIKCVSDDKVTELQRMVRFAVEDLLGSHFQPSEARNMSLGLAHGLGRFRIKFSAEKVDTMVIQAVSLHEDLDKEINNYMMRLREWYGHHFPELARVVPDNLLYSKVVSVMGNRKNSSEANFEDLLTEELRQEVIQASEVSIGTEISETDEKFINALASQIIELDNYRNSLEEYLKGRMMNVAPNLSSLVGEIIAAKLISKAGSLINLAKMSGSTIQIIGAEKALFKAMRAHKKTPKYGIIYQTRLISGAQGRAKARIARALAAKSALCVRFDALNEEESNNLGTENLDYLEKRLKYLEMTESGAAVSKQQKGGQFTKEHGNDIAKKSYGNRADFTPRGPALEKREMNGHSSHGFDKKVKRQ